MNTVLFRKKLKLNFVVAIGSILLSLSTPIFAYDEPDNFAGVKFGEDVTAQVLNCRDSIAGLDNKPCWEELTKGQRGYLKNVGEIEKFVESISYRQIDKKLEMVSLNFRSEKLYKSTPDLTVGPRRRQSFNLHSRRNHLFFR